LEGYFFSLAAVLRHLVQIFTFFPPIFFVWIFMANTRFEAILEWERLWAALGPRLQIWQTRDIFS
jgi:hypothetical protein